MRPPTVDEFNQYFVDYPRSWPILPNEVREFWFSENSLVGDDFPRFSLVGVYREAAAFLFRTINWYSGLSWRAVRDLSGQYCWCATLNPQSANILLTFFLCGRLGSLRLSRILFILRYTLFVTAVSVVGSLHFLLPEGLLLANIIRPQMSVAGTASFFFNVDVSRPAFLFDRFFIYRTGKTGVVKSTNYLLQLVLHSFFVGLRNISPLPMLVVLLKVGVLSSKWFTSSTDLRRQLYFYLRRFFTKKRFLYSDRLGPHALLSLFIDIVGGRKLQMVVKYHRMFLASICSILDVKPVVYLHCIVGCGCGNFPGVILDLLQLSVNWVRESLFWGSVVSTFLILRSDLQVGLRLRQRYAYEYRYIVRSSDVDEVWSEFLCTRFILNSTASLFAVIFAAFWCLGVTLVNFRYWDVTAGAGGLRQVQLAFAGSVLRISDTVSLDVGSHLGLVGNSLGRSLRSCVTQVELLGRSWFGFGSVDLSPRVLGAVDALCFFLRHLGASFLSGRALSGSIRFLLTRARTVRRSKSFLASIRGARLLVLCQRGGIPRIRGCFHGNAVTSRWAVASFTAGLFYKNRFSGKSFKLAGLLDPNYIFPKTLMRDTFFRESAFRFSPVERLAPGIVERIKVDGPLHTGVKAVDSMVPVGRGQRQLIIGDINTGKTTLAVDILLGQRRFSNFLFVKPIFCFYVTIGLRRSDVAGIVRVLGAEEALPHTSLVITTSSDACTLQYVSAYAGCSFCEYYRDAGLDTMVVYDDLTAHAVAYRQMSLLLGHPASREAYPGDVFYLHARLLERAGQMNLRGNYGSITALPVAQTLFEDVSAYIPTNLISITDGQIYLLSTWFTEGIRPALDAGLSVSRIGAAAQLPFLANARSLMARWVVRYRIMAPVGAAPSPTGEKYMHAVARRGFGVLCLVQQGLHDPVPAEVQGILVRLCLHKVFEDFPATCVAPAERFLSWFFYSRFAESFWAFYTSRGLFSLIQRTFLDRCCSVMLGTLNATDIVGQRSLCFFEIATSVLLGQSAVLLV